MTQTIASTTKELASFKKQQKREAVEHKTLRELLIQVEQELATSTDPRSKKAFTNHHQTNDTLFKATGWRGLITELGFITIVQKAQEAVIDHRDANGFVDEAAIVRNPWGRLAATIVRVYCASFGEAFARSYLASSGGLRVIASDRLLALQFVERLLAPEENQMGTIRSMVQVVIEEGLNVKQLTAFIKNHIKSFAKHECKQNKLARKQNPFNRVTATADKEDEGTVFHRSAAHEVLADIDLEAEMLQVESNDFVTDVFLRALFELSPVQKEVMRAYFSNEGSEIYGNFGTFRNQIKALAEMLSITQADSLLIADQIIESLKSTFIVEVEKRETKTKVFADRRTQMRARQGEANVGRRAAKTKHVMLRDDEAVSPILTDRFVAGVRVSPFVIPSHVDSFRQLFQDRKIPFAQIMKALR